MRRIKGIALAAALMGATFTISGSPAALAEATPSPAGSAFKPLSPVRVLDTRTGSGPVGPNGTVTLNLAGRVPAGATAVVMNVTGTAPTAATYVTAFPTGTERPTASNLNLIPGQTRPNFVTVAVGDGTRVSLYNDQGSVHLIADLAGYYGADATGKFTVFAAKRVLDTRTGSAVGPQTTRTLDLTEAVPASATAVTFNLTGLGATADTFVTAWPADHPRPIVSNLNLRPGNINPNQVTVALGASRRVNLYNDAGNVHLLADLSGYYTPEYGATFNPLTPQRILDTRATGRPIGGGDWIHHSFANSLTDTTIGVVMNVTGTQPTNNTHVAVSPDGEATEGSHLNLAPGQTAANLVTVGTNSIFAIRFFNAAGTVHVIADLAGYFAIPPTAPCTNKCVYAWGDNIYGQLGTGFPVYQARIGKQVYGLSDVKMIAGASRHTYALREDGTVWGWGGNYSAQLGGFFGTWFVVPIRVEGLSNITAIDDGVALRGDGTVWTWGTKPGHDSGLRPGPVAGLNNIVAVASGASTSYALRNDGTLLAWGANYYGELGIGAPRDFYAKAPVQVLTGVRSIESTELGAMALKSDGSVWGWGFNSYGQIGNGAVGDAVFTAMKVPNLTGVTAIAAGYSQRFAVLTNGTAWAWGDNLRGALGNGQACATSCANPVPVQVSGLSNVRGITANDSGGYAIDAGNRLWSWGENIHGQLGETETGDPYAGHSPIPLRLSTLTGVSMVSGGLRAGFALVP